MKKILLVSAALAVVLFSCKKAEAPVVDNEYEDSDFVKDSITKECYMGVSKKDTFTAQFNIVDKEVKSGRLAYKFFEKDKSNGYVSGRIAGDTILLTYSFMSEGGMSSREVIFLKKGNTLIEGFGDIATDSTGKVTFKDRSKISFDEKVVLTKTTQCK